MIGGFSEYVALSESKALHVPEGVTFAQAAIATDAVATAYHAVVVDRQISASSKIAIIGLGGLGLSAVRSRLDLGQKYMASNATTESTCDLQVGAYACAKSIGGFPGVRFNVVVDFAGAGSTTVAATKAVKAGGKVVLVGLSLKEAQLNTYEYFAMGITLKGAAGSSMEEAEKCL